MSMEGWAEIWGIPKVVFPLKIARNAEELAVMLKLTFEAEIRGPDSTKLGEETALVTLRGDFHEICFQPEETGHHMIQMKANGKNFCPPIRVEVLGDGTVRRIEEHRRKTATDQPANADDLFDSVSVGSDRQRTAGSVSSVDGTKYGEERAEPEKEVVEVGRGRKASTSSSVIHSPTGQLFVEMDGRLMRLEDAEMKRAAATPVVIGNDDAKKRKKKKSLGESIAAFFRIKRPSEENFGKPRCHLCESFTKLKNVMVLERRPYCKTCFERLFMCKGPQDHLEGLQARPENDRLAPRQRKYSISKTARYSDYPNANLTGLKIKEVQYAQSQYRKFDSQRTERIENRFMYDLLSKCLRFRLSEHKVAATLQSQRLAQAMFQCGLDRSPDVTELEFLNILAFITREKTTSWLSENMLKTSQSASAPNILERSKSDIVKSDVVKSTSNQPRYLSRHTSSSSSVKSYSSHRNVTKLDTIPSLNDLDSVVDSETDQDTNKELGFSNTTADSWMMY